MVGTHRRGACNQKACQGLDSQQIRLAQIMAGEDKASASLAGKIKRALNKAIIKK